MTSNRYFLIFIIIAVFSTFGCDTGSSKDLKTQNFDVVKSQKNRDLTPNVTPANETELVQGNTEFALDFYSELIDSEESNFFYSPISISIALAMTYAGLDGNTKTEVGDIMHFTLPEADLHPAFNALDLDLMSRGTGDASQFRLSIANAIWGQAGYSFEQAFLDVIALNYGSGLNLLDFAADPEGSRTTINNWVEDETEGKIKDLLPEGSITSLTKMVLTNAIYFWGEWVTMFSKDLTSDSTWTKDDGSTVITKFMSLPEANISYYSGTGYKACELPYKGNDTSMIIIMPDAGTMGSFESTLDASLLSSIISVLSPTDMAFYLPKFSFESSINVKPLLENLGVHDAFNPGDADLSGFNGRTDLYISDILHKAFVAVNEDGTEAAAATAVIIGNTSIPSVTLSIDHPFIFLIRDKITGTILFMGRMMDPTL